MKKGSLILESMMLGFLTGYGAWCMYKKMCPAFVEDVKDGIEHGVKKMTKKVDKFAEDMM